jgi:Integrase zinc binding domain
LKLYKYNLQLDYKPGKKIPLADFLSRFTTNAVEKNHEDERKNVYIEETQNDPELAILIKYYQEGWPSDKTKVQELVKYYYKFRNEIYVSDGLVFYENRVIIPQSLRDTVLKALHCGHFGISKTFVLAKETVFWPYMSQSIENMISRCELCNEFQRSNQKVPNNHSTFNSRSSF